MDLTQSELEHPGREEIELPAVLQALADPQRLEIVRLLGSEEEPCPCGSLRLGLAKSTMSHHLKVLREAGLIAQYRQGTAKLTWLRSEDIDARFPGLLDAVRAEAGDAAAPVAATA